MRSASFGPWTKGMRYGFCIMQSSTVYLPHDHPIDLTYGRINCHNLLPMSMVPNHLLVFLVVHVEHLEEASMSWPGLLGRMAIGGDEIEQKEVATQCFPWGGQHGQEEGRVPFKPQPN